MRFWILFLIAGLLFGCRTTSIEKRRDERYPAYASLSPEWRQLVDQGQIAIGMPQDAVFIAWGKPSQVMHSQSEHGQSTVWIYSGTAWQEYRYWNYRYSGLHYGRRGRYYRSYPEMYLDYDYIPYNYTAAEVVFENGVVKSWRNLTAPPL